MSSHYKLVPKDFKANLKWRREVLQNGAVDPDFAGAIWRMCSEDILFYINGFCWTFDPRDVMGTTNKPFITYGFQDEAITEIVKAISTGYDIAFPKSRTMGASWVGLTVFEWFWHFNETALTFGLVSKKEICVDNVGDSDSLFWKIDYLHKNQPRWLLPSNRWLGWKDPGRRLLHLKNADTGSTIKGESTTGNMFRSGRLTGLFMDEFGAIEVRDGYKILGATRDVTRCRLFNSTPQGMDNAFYDVIHKTGAKVFPMHWRSHPVYNKGRYTSIRQVDGSYNLKLVTDFKGVVRTQRKAWDEPREFKYPDHYPFILDGKERSPWYDGEYARCVSEQEIAQELDINFLGSGGHQYFDPEFIQMLIAKHCVPPVMKGRLEYDPISLEPSGFRIDENGPLWLWFNIAGSEGLLTDKAFIRSKTFGLGSDVSFGSGASNSATSVVDLTTGKKIALWKDPNTEPEEFANETIALAKWFGNGFMIWDGSGPVGKSFTNRVIEQKYNKIYYSKNELKTRARITDRPGFYMNDEARRILLGEYRTKLSTQTYINPSEAGMTECLQFIVKTGGKVEHSASANSQDPRGAREAHGDEVIADALASKILSLKSEEIKNNTPEIPYMSIAWRLEQEKLALATKRYDW